MQRDHLLDNAKFFTMIFVVFGHLIESMLNAGPIVKTTYLSIYSFHMPALVLISGMLAKSDYRKLDINKLISNIVIPLISFTILYEINNVLTEGSISKYTKNLWPYWIMWYLVSLFLWKLLLPIILKFRFPLLLSIAVSIAAGYFNSIGYFLGISRTLYFFPFFILGYKLTPSALHKIKPTLSVRTIALCLIVLNVVVCAFMVDLPYQWLYGSFSYARLGNNNLSAVAIKTTIYMFTTVTVIAFFLLIPRSKSLFSKLGANSIYVYLWHGFFIKALPKTGFIGLLHNLPITVALLCLFGVSIVIMLLLSTDVVARQTQKLVILPMSLILQGRSPKPPPAPRPEECP